MKKIFISLTIFFFNIFANDFIKLDPILLIDQSGKKHLFYTSYMENNDGFIVNYEHEIHSEDGTITKIESDNAMNLGSNKVSKHILRSIIFSEKTNKTIFLQNFQLLSPGWFKHHKFNDILNSCNYYTNGIPNITRNMFDDITDKEFSKKYTNNHIIFAEYRPDMVNIQYKFLDESNSNLTFLGTNGIFINDKNFVTLAKNSNNELFLINSDLKTTNYIDLGDESAVKAIVLKDGNDALVYFIQNESSYIKHIRVLNGIEPNIEKIYEDDESISRIYSKDFLNTSQKFNKNSSLAGTMLEDNNLLLLGYGNFYPTLKLIDFKTSNPIATYIFEKEINNFSLTADKYGDIHIAYVKDNKIGQEKIYLKDIIKTERENIFGSEKNLIENSIYTNSFSANKAAFNSFNTIRSNKKSISASINVNPFIPKDSLIAITFEMPIINKPLTVGASLNTSFGINKKNLFVSPYIKYKYKFYELRANLGYGLISKSDEIKHSMDIHKYTSFTNGIFLDVSNEFKKSTSKADLSLLLDIQTYLGVTNKLKFKNMYNQELEIGNKFVSTNTFKISTPIDLKINKNISINASPFIKYNLGSYSDKLEHSIYAGLQSNNKFNVKKAQVNLQASADYDFINKNINAKIGVGVEF